MVRRLGILALALALGFSTAQATETGIMAFRAQKLYNNNEYPEAMQMLQRAILSSAKEADLEGEQRVRLAMARILFHAFEFNVADSLLNGIRTSSLNQSGKLAMLLLRMEMLNHQAQYAESKNLFESEKEKLNEDSQETLRAFILLEYSIALAATGGTGIADTVEEAEDLLDDEAPGALLFAQARIADLKGEANASELYTQSLHLAQKSQKSWVAGKILMRLGQLVQSTDPKAAADYYLRAAKLYDQIRLDRPFIAAAEAFLALDPGDQQLAILLNEAKSRVSAPSAPAPAPSAE